MSLAGRVSAAFLVLLTLMAALAAYHLALIHRLREDNRRLARVELDVARTCVSLRGDLAEMVRLTRIFFVRRDRGYAAQLEEMRRNVAATLARLGDHPLTAGEERALTDLAAAWDVYSTAAPAAERDFLAGGRAGRERRELPAQLGALDARVEILGDAARQAMSEHVAEAAEEAARAQSAAWMATTLAVVAAVVLALVLAGSVARPLARLGRGTHEMAQGHFAFRVPETGSRELVALAREFNAMADRLGELDELKRDFVSSVSHDLKAPLASMQETTDLLLEGTPGPLTESQRRLLQLNHQCGERLSGMIADLLDAARLEAGAVRFELAEADLAGLTRQALEEIEGAAHARDLAVETDLAPAPVEADAALLPRLLSNLLSNAVKFSPEGGTLRVRVRGFDDAGELAAAYRRHPGGPAPPVAVFEVEDAGPGIPDAEKDLVFERFHRADPRRRGVQGSGLGLAIARGIAEGHGGELWVEDAAASPSGSRFVLVLPSRRAPRAIAASRHAASGGGGAPRAS
jgi:signal transduction histidine kinase